MNANLNAVLASSRERELRAIVGRPDRLMERELKLARSS